MTRRTVRSAIELVIEEVISDFSLEICRPDIQRQIREQFEEAIAKGVLAAIAVSRGHKYVSQVLLRCKDSIEAVERLVSSDPRLTETSFVALGHIKADLTNEISDRIAAAIRIVG